MPLAFFSDLLETDEREQLAEKLRSCPPPSQPLQTQLPVFSAMTPETKLSDLIRERSYLNVLRFTGSQLQLASSAEWDE